MMRLFSVFLIIVSVLAQTTVLENYAHASDQLCLQVPSYSALEPGETAVIFIVDKSRSMSFKGRLDSVKRALRQAFPRFEDDLAVGITGIDSVPFILVPVSSWGSVKKTAEMRIDKLFPVGRSEVFNGLEEGVRQLRKSKRKRLHIILISDLDDRGIDSRRATDRSSLLMRLLDDKISLSFIGLGNEYPFSFLSTLAKCSGGKSYDHRDGSTES